MDSRYTIKLSSVIRQILEIYMRFDPLKHHNTVSAYLKPVIYDKVNKILDYLESKMEENEELKEELNKKENENILYLIKEKERFS